MPIRSLAHVCLKTRDLAQTAHFYCGALGFKEAFQFRKNGQVIGFYLQAGNTTFIEVFRDENAEIGSPQRMLNHFCLETDEIEKLRQRLVEGGFHPGDLIMGADNALQFWVKDPNGIDVEIQQYAPDSSQLTGQTIELA